jgi:hypothetical protein
LYTRVSEEHAASSIFRVEVRRVRKLMGYIGFGGGSGRKILVGKPQWKTLLGRPGSRYEDNIKMDLRETGCDGLASVELAQNRIRWWALVSMIMNFQVP